MSYTVNTAFDKFMKEVVDLDPTIVSEARSSRDNLLENIKEFDEKNGFFKLYSEKDVHFGSFSRKTKCRELDDIDLMVCISAEGATYNQFNSWNDIKIMASSTSVAQKDCTRDDGTLNSTQVANKFKNELKNVREYARSDVRRNGEAVVLNLRSKVWSFDVVPCFYTAKENNGRQYYLIPNGKGNWKKTDPTWDKERVTAVNQGKDGRLLELVRLCKKWNQVKLNHLIPSYLLETLVVNFAESQYELNQWIDYRFADVLSYISYHVYNNVADMKEIQGNINMLEFNDKIKISEKASADYSKATEAKKAETLGNPNQALLLWRDILGEEFPTNG